MPSNDTAMKISLILLAVAAILWLKEFFFAITVPSGSMLPAIRPGDRILIRRLTRPTGLRRGDIVVFRSTHDQKGDGRLLMIKRLIGLPGEAVELKGHKVLINGQQIREPYVRLARETEKSFRVPKHCYLFLGDNRTASHDARYWQDPYVRGREISGKAIFRIGPLKRFGFLK